MELDLRDTCQMRLQSFNRLFHVLLISLSLISCTAVSSPLPTGDPMVDNLALASQEVAKWGKDTVLTRVGSRYTVEEGEFVFTDHSYLFVSTDGAASYFVVRVRADGEISSGPAAGMAVFEPIAYDFAKNGVTEQDAIDLAWELYGRQLVEACGPLRWVDVGGGIGEGQFWSVGYRIGGNLFTVFLDAASGDIFEMDEIDCS